MLMMSFYDALTRANFSFVYFLQFRLLKFFLTFFKGGGFEPPNSPLATPLTEMASFDHGKVQGPKHTTYFHYDSRKKLQQSRIPKNPLVGFVKAHS